MLTLLYIVCIGLYHSLFSFSKRKGELFWGVIYGIGSYFLLFNASSYLDLIGTSVSRSFYTNLSKYEATLIEPSSYIALIYAVIVAVSLFIFLNKLRPGADYTIKAIHEYVLFYILNIVLLFVLV